MISVTANGKNGFFFVSDTGASICLLGESFRGDPQITADPQTPNMVTVSSVRVGENVYEKITAAISDIGAIKATPHNCVCESPPSFRPTSSV